MIYTEKIKNAISKRFGITVIEFKNKVNKDENIKKGSIFSASTIERYLDAEFNYCSKYMYKSLRKRLHVLRKGVKIT